MKKKTEKVLKEFIYEILLIIGAINLGATLRYHLSWLVGIIAILLAVFN